MKIIGEIHPEIKGLVNRILRKVGDCESLLGKRSWYGKDIWCGLLFCSYGVIGYDIDYEGFSISVDNELHEIRIE